MCIRVHRYHDVDAFLHRASDWLHRREAEHNLVLGISRQLKQGTHDYQNPIYLATVEDGEQILGCAYRTPPWKAGLTQLAAGAIPPLVQDMAAVYSKIPAVLGRETDATEFARLWTGLRGGCWKIGMRQRLHVLNQVSRIPLLTAGSLRTAGPGDLTLLKTWISGFVRDVGICVDKPFDLAARLVSSESLFLWEDDRPRAMAAALGQTEHGIRIGYVYTPPEFRGRGYATTLVARLSQSMLDQGRDYCCLYTDLANPTSNAIYARIGYRPHSDLVDVNFI